MSAARAWLAGLSPRERTLVLVAAALLGLLAFLMLVVRPIASAREDGVARYEEATETYAAVARAAGMPDAGGAAGDGPLRTVLSESAEAYGVVIDRYDIDEDAVDLTIASTDAGSLYAWLGELSEIEGIVVREGAVRASGEAGQITARLTMSR